MAERRLRPMGLGDIFDEGFDLYKKNFSLLLLVTIVFTVPLDIVLAGLRMLYWHSASDLPGLSSDDPTIMFTALGSVFGKAGEEMLVASLLYAVPLAALAAATSARYLGEAITLRQAYRPPLRRLPGLLGTALLYGLAITAGFFLCFIGFFWIGVSLLFTVHVFVLEGKAGGAAFQRASRLVSGDWWRVFGALALLTLIYTVMQVSIEVPLGYVFDTLLRLAPGGHGLSLMGDTLHANSIRRQVVNQLSGGLADLLILPFLLSVMTVLYYDLRVRKEAFDIELLARDLGYAPFTPGPGLPPPASLPPAPPFVTPGPARGRQ